MNDQLDLAHISPRFHDIVRDLVFVLRRKSRILMVVDNDISYSAGGGFGIGRVISIMNNATLGCASFEVKLAQRSGTQSKNANAGLHQLTYSGFRFDQTEPDGSLIINQFDQIWCFGFDPGNGQPNNLNPAIDVNITNHPWAINTNELEKLTRWMNDRRGGLFATGDHHYLGASLCSRIPRLGIMRKWTVTDGVPTIGGTSRLDTNRPATPGQQAGTDIIPNGVESDAVPQKIRWVAEQTIWSSPFFTTSTPHPILCHPTLGPIDVMPDHPHEGRCFDPSDPDWISTRRDATYNYNGYSGHHFPSVDGERPLPRIIAWGNTLSEPPLRFAKGPQEARSFPMISVYDGQKVGIGRVVTDSTWHHWFNMNLDGLAAAADTTYYQKIERYFINIGIWLASPAWRSAMSWCPLVVSRFEYFGLMERTLNTHLLDIGRTHLEFMRLRLGPCWVRTWLWEILAALDRKLVYWLEDRIKPMPWPCLSCPPIELLETAVMGGIVRTLFSDERELQTRLSMVDKLQFELSPKEIERRIQVGAAQGLAEFGKLYSESLQTQLEQMNSLTKLIPKSPAASTPDKPPAKPAKNKKGEKKGRTRGK